MHRRILTSREAHTTSYVCESVTSGTHTGRKRGVYFFCHICPIIRCKVRKCLVELTDLILSAVCGGRWGLSGGKSLHCELMVQRELPIRQTYANEVEVKLRVSGSLSKPLKSRNKRRRGSMGHETQLSFNSFDRYFK